jgi:hypothetical protein
MGRRLKSDRIANWKTPSVAAIDTSNVQWMGEHGVNFAAWAFPIVSGEGSKKVRRVQERGDLKLTR